MTAALLGIGNVLRRDDGVGVVVARAADAWRRAGRGFRDWAVFDCGVCPEAFVGPLLRLAPERAVLVDAADMGLEPGEVRTIDPGRLAGGRVGTHDPGLGPFVDRLARSGIRCTVLGVQPADASVDIGLTPAVASAVPLILKALSEDRSFPPA